jgi:hypothetical protein
VFSRNRPILGDGTARDTFLFITGLLAVFRRLLPLALLAIPLAVACSVSDASSPFADGTGKPREDGTVGLAPETPSTGDKGPTDAGPVGSPLCGVTAKSCTPDDDGTRPLPEGMFVCATPVPDAGGAEAKSVDASTADYACRVQPNAAPFCPKQADSQVIPNADKDGVDGVACQTDMECAPGFDCVAAASGEKTNVCRRYCCSASCDGVSSHNGGPTFCDVRKVVRNQASPIDAPLLAPVCMPIKTCTLLKPGDCADGETCAIVNDKGATGCVPTDGDELSAQEKQSCEKKHCATGLTCLGTPGDRTCYKLCKTTGGHECRDDQVCTTGSAFVDTSYGVCKSAQ